MCSNFIARLPSRPNHCSRYSLYLHAALYASGWNRLSIKQTTGIQNLDLDAYLNLKCLFPSFDEQQVIANYLDQKTAKISDLVEKNRRNIDLLTEKRQAIVGRTVTRGLNGRVQLRASGSPWLGDLPNHWSSGRLRRHSEIRVSSVDKHTRDDETTVRLCNYVDVYYNDFITSAMRFMPATATPHEVERFRLARGDVLITKDSEVWNDIGVPSLVSEESPDLVLGYHLAILRPDRRHLLGEYLLRVLQSGVARQFHVAARGVTRYGLSYDDLKSIRIPVPPIREQEAIVRYLERATADIDAAVAGVRQEIKFLTEYRAKLIVDVVTGRLDVREREVHWQESHEEKGFRRRG